MSEIEHARAMLTMAERDLKALKGMEDSQTFAEEIFGFHAQQVVEKTLKAWIAAWGEEYPLTHNIARLLAILQDKGGEVENYWDLVEYTAYAVEFRYDFLNTVEEPLDRLRVMDRVQSIFDHVKHIIEASESSG